MNFLARRNVTLFVATFFLCSGAKIHIVQIFCPSHNHHTEHCCQCQRCIEQCLCLDSVVSGRQNLLPSEALLHHCHQKLLLNYLRWCRWMLLLDRRILDSNKDMASKHLALYNIRPRRVLLHNKSKRGIQFPDGGHTWPLHNQKQPNLSPGDETCQCQDQHIRKDCQGSVNQFQQQLMKMQMK